ncbi:zinc transporter ZIP1 isoform X2 [Bicyclus anynana]|uniref:Zinc transporter ZIP1 isoform X2 n=1 Tax=Bicyclus anynana TaxID=110368 RepID=A0ABM3LYB1_BICAN|nr:zinc transporter ZIP1 isoform X2 [Bicyclus anynana]
MADIEPMHGPNDTEGVLVAKGVSMLVLFCACMICGLVPMFVARKFNWITPEEAGTLKSKNKIVMTLLSFGGGVLLSTTFLHLLPEVDHNIYHLQEKGLMQEFDFALAPLLMICGFFLMYLVEELVHIYLRRRERRSGQSSPLVRNLSVRRSQVSVDGKGEKSVNNSTADLIDPNSIRLPKDVEVNNHNHAGHGHSHLPINEVDGVNSAIRGLLVVLALSIHELFEGLAVGLESSTAHVWYMLGAVAAHKLVIAFCISVELVAIRTKTWLTVVYIVVYAIVSPLGIAIGIILVGGEGATAAGVYSVVLQGLASGTLLYVIFFEIWSNDREGIIQYIAAVVGFGLMFGLQLLTGHSHSHSHGGSDTGDHGHSHDDHGHSHDR